ncbi:NAD(P)H-quinone oxidoreductase subunit 5 [Striga asiatica]|uniref:NAD(P)H-quinone oxidoreductase subunit 5 n=1 Tax=Striga asiatica TaxID=4170 RepID=A0A5A7NXW3_STRAF|nr:NAD(P)H-quinone oxidoreductase subunit 5 [Striga asiatica]
MDTSSVIWVLSGSAMFTCACNWRKEEQKNLGWLYTIAFEEVGCNVLEMFAVVFEGVSYFVWRSFNSTEKREVNIRRKVLTSYMEPKNLRSETRRNNSPRSCCCWFRVQLLLLSLLARSFYLLRMDNLNGDGSEPNSTTDSRHSDNDARKKIGRKGTRLKHLSLQNGKKVAVTFLSLRARWARLSEYQ